MIYHTYVPRSPLSQLVSFLWSSEGDTLPHAQVRLLPIGAMELVINLHSDTIPLFDSRSQVLCGSTRGVRLCGIQSESFIIDKISQVSVMGVRFKPDGGAAFLRLPAKELHNQIASLETLWNHPLPEVAALREQLQTAPHLDSRFAVLEQFLVSLIAPLPQPHPVVQFALREFGRSPMPTVKAVVDQTGLSDRHFGQLFRDRVGLTPKLFCRIQRLRRVLQLLSGKDQVDWMDVALECGYFDQAHFIHDFRRFAGCTPSVYLSQRGLSPCHVLLPD